MVAVPVFHGRVSTDAALRLEPSEASKRKAWLSHLVGRDVEITIRDKRQRRSIDQNNWVWGIAYPVIAEALGYDEHEHEQLHYALLGECYGTAYDQRFGRELPRVSSSKLNTKQFSEYMEWLVRWAATEHGIVVPLPGESEAA